MIQRRVSHTHPRLRRRDATCRCILVSDVRPIVRLVEWRIYPRDFAYVIAILFEITDPTLQYLFSCLRKFRLRVKVDHRTG